MPKIPLSVVSGDYSLSGVSNNVAFNMSPITVESSGLGQVIASQLPSLEYLDYSETINGSYAERPEGQLQGWGFISSEFLNGILFCANNALWIFVPSNRFLYKVIDGGGAQITIPAQPRLDCVKIASNGLIVAIVISSPSSPDYYLTLTAASFINKTVTATLEPISVAAPNYTTLTSGQGSMDVVYLDGYFCYITNGLVSTQPRVLHGTLKTVNNGKDIRLEDFTDLDTSINVTALFEYRGQLVASTMDKMYFFQNVGNVDFAFQLLKGQTQDIGIRSTTAYRKTTNDVVFIGTDNSNSLGVYSLSRGKLSNDFIDRVLSDFYLRVIPWDQNFPALNGVYMAQYQLNDRSYIGVGYYERDVQGDIVEGETYSMDLDTNIWFQNETRTEEVSGISSLPYFAIDHIISPSLTEVQSDTTRSVIMGWGAATDFSTKENYFFAYCSGDSYEGDFLGLNTTPTDLNSYEISLGPVSDLPSVMTISAIGISGKQLNADIEAFQTEDLDNYISLGSVTCDNNDYNEWRRLGGSLNLKQFKFKFSGGDRSRPFVVVTPYAKGKASDA